MKKKRSTKFTAICYHETSSKLCPLKILTFRVKFVNVIIENRSMLFVCVSSKKLDIVRSLLAIFGGVKWFKIFEISSGKVGISHSESLGSLRTTEFVRLYQAFLYKYFAFETTIYDVQNVRTQNAILSTECCGILEFAL